MDPMLLTLGFAAAAVGAVLVANALRAPQVDAEAVLAELDTEPTVLDEFATRLKDPIVTRLLRPLAGAIGEKIAVLVPRRRADQLRHRLLVAGVSAKVGPEEFVVMQGVGLGAGVLLGLLVAQTSGYHGFGLIRMVVILAGMGVFAPVAWLRRKQDERQGSIRRDLPDVLDLLAISVEAGVGFEGAVEVVTRHFQSPLATEFARMLQEMELGLPRREALQNLKRRTEVPELSNFVLILVQADALGMPIGRVLRTQATEMRLKRRAWAREKAARLPVKILLPLTLFILPALFVVILGPAAMSIAKNL
ncbi:MAG TPA: type II secretion system F family protein [Acidimicrobiia bacterium]|nr:type II secretion system F family protein [Acidimicrobiia bacterium]HKN92288.1 type II secretion system F family protein [Acidimicrobiia bacterium]